MKPSRSFLFVGAAILAGCATPFSAPPNAAHVQLIRESSPVVIVDKIWLERKKGPLVLRGYVIKRLTAEDTTQTHLDITLFDSSGTVLRSSVEHFEPRQIPRRYRRPDYANYSIMLDPLPPATARIEVRAHEGKHS